MRKPHNFCQRFFHPLTKEFKLDKFSLKHQPVDDFFKSQWQRHRRAVWWLIYRWVLSALFCAGVFDTMVRLFYEGRWFIYLTAWGFFLCMFTSLFGAVLVSIYFYKPNYFASDSWTLKVYWASHWSTLVVATMISFVYWVFLYPFDTTGVAFVYNFLAHGCNSILMVLDHMLVAFPTQILHFIYPFGVCITYGIFSLIYYFAGGVDVEGSHYIYIILNWENPGLAIATIFGCMALMFIMCIVLFGLYKLRCYIYRKINHSRLELKT